MALPTPDKTWYTDLNVEERTGGTGGLDRRRILFNIKNKLCNLPVPWVVAGSSDGITSGMDGPANGGSTDRWTAAGDVRFGDAGVDGAAFNVSWIVLRQSAINPKFELLIKCHTSNPSGGCNASIRVSPLAGFGVVNGGTDGSIDYTDPPTATDHIALLAGTNVTSGSSAASWLDGESGTNPTAQDFIVHYWQSSDGECTRICILNVGAPSFNCMTAFFEKPKNPITAWTNPAVFSWHNLSVTTGLHRYTLFNDVSTYLKYVNPVHGEDNFYLTCEGYKAGTIPEQLLIANELTGAWEIFPMAFASNSAVEVGYYGERYDIWWVSTALNNADTMPLTPAPTKEFCVFDDMLMLWDGTTPLTS